jgi:hypothetical protein
MHFKRTNYGQSFLIIDGDACSEQLAHSAIARRKSRLLLPHALVPADLNHSKNILKRGEERKINNQRTLLVLESSSESSSSKLIFYPS